MCATLVSPCGQERFDRGAFGVSRKSGGVTREVGSRAVPSRPVDETTLGAIEGRCSARDPGAVTKDIFRPRDDPNPAAVRGDDRADHVPRGRPRRTGSQTADFHLLRRHVRPAVGTLQPTFPLSLDPVEQRLLNQAQSS